MDSKALVTSTDAEKIQKQREQFTNWMRMCHQEPEKIETNKFANNTKYVPISYIEMKLDELFIDGWNLEIKSVEQVLNSIVVTVRVSGLNPATGREFYRDGVGSKAIQLNNGSKPMDISNIKANALELAYPAAKAQALKNAAQTIGKVFGRDVARKLDDEYNPIIKTTEDKEDSYAKAIKKWNASKKDQATLDAFLKEARKQGIEKQFIEYVQGESK
jgi:hypothetical protein